MSNPTWAPTGSTYPLRTRDEGSGTQDAPVAIFIVGVGFIVGAGRNTEHPLEAWLDTHTGGDAARLIAIACDRSGSAVRTTQLTAGISPPTPREAPEALAHIQSAFGLSVTALASVLRVERPTIYSWLRSTNVPTAANRQRIEQVANLADQWLALSGGSPPKDLRAEVLAGKSLLELLSEEHLRTFAAETAMRALWKRIGNAAVQRPSLREIALARGFSGDSTEFDATTGRRFTDDD